MPRNDRRNNRQDNYDDYDAYDTNDREESTWETFDDNEDSLEFARRQQGAKRESAKRELAAQKQVRQEREAEFTGTRHRDRRAIEKERKRRSNELKKLADELGIKQTLQQLNDVSVLNCWGPDIVSDKDRPSVAAVLNYTDHKAGTVINPAERLTAKLYGAWLYYRGNQIMVAIGTKAPGETETHVDHAQPPGQGDCILQLPYDSVHHEHLSQQITSVLLNDGPLS